MGTSQRYHLVESPYELAPRKYVEIAQLPRGNEKGTMIIVCNNEYTESIFQVQGDTLIFDDVPHTMRTFVDDDGTQYLRMEMADDTIQHFVLSDCNPSPFEVVDLDEQYYAPDPTWEIETENVFRIREAGF